jgi:hypothetical protein
MQIGDCLGSGMEAHVVLLEEPWASGEELAEGGDEAVAENIAMARGVEGASMELGMA